MDTPKLYIKFEAWTPFEEEQDGGGDELGGEEVDVPDESDLDEQILWIAIPNQSQNGEMMLKYIQPDAPEDTPDAEEIVEEWMKGDQGDGLEIDLNDIPASSLIYIAMTPMNMSEYYGTNMAFDGFWPFSEENIPKSVITLN
eukprot:TRINITY_DN27052_c0_g1_i1.p1 TRINITY_DN27052_c0_g1~~TRINITY_DN27052_c0_g1_i1.p1  ORF type:complete len:167 (-),score=47.25 TRINITY_DN27052_c0_g1_i1:29-454(-)